MSQIETIKDLQAIGLGPVAIAERLNVTRKTVSKYMAAEAFETKPKVQQTELPSKLDPFKPLIQQWLEEDRKNRYKQRHTAMRIHKRLLAECEDYDASYPLVQRYVKRLREYRHKEGTLELVWEPGEAQVDFGEADFVDASGQKRMYKFLCVSFPYSNAGYVQLFGGETAECVAHGLQDIFHRIGGVPTRLIFDNASGVGRRVSENVRMAEVFLRFKAHYGFAITFCNPIPDTKRATWKTKSVICVATCLYRCPRSPMSKLLTTNCWGAAKPTGSANITRRARRFTCCLRQTRKHFSTCPRRRLPLVAIPK